MEEGALRIDISFGIEKAEIQEAKGKMKQAALRFGSRISVVEDGDDLLFCFGIYSICLFPACSFVCRVAVLNNQEIHSFCNRGEDVSVQGGVRQIVKNALMIIQKEMPSLKVRGIFLKKKKKPVVSQRNVYFEEEPFSGGRILRKQKIQFDRSQHRNTRRRF